MDGRRGATSSSRSTTSGTSAPGENEDFESLVKLLEPRPMDKRVGIRDMDGSKPGFGHDARHRHRPDPAAHATDRRAQDDHRPRRRAHGADDEVAAAGDRHLASRSSPNSQSILNFPATCRTASNTATPIPSSCPPIYGENHARSARSRRDASRLAARSSIAIRGYRVPAGFGTNVVQKYQEDYVARAWAQVQKVLDINRAIRFASSRWQVGEAIQKAFVSYLPPAEMLTVFAPVMKKVKGSPTTLHHQLRESRSAAGGDEPALRRMIRPRGAYGRRLRAADPQFTQAALVADLNDERGQRGAAQAGAAATDHRRKIADTLPAPAMPPWLRSLIRHRRCRFFSCCSSYFCRRALHRRLVGRRAACRRGDRRLRHRQALAAGLRAADAIRDPATVAAEVENAPPRPGFQFIVSDPVTPSYLLAGTQVTTSIHVDFLFSGCGALHHGDPAHAGLGRRCRNAWRRRTSARAADRS